MFRMFFKFFSGSVKIRTNSWKSKQIRNIKNLLNKSVSFALNLTQLFFLLWNCLVFSSICDISYSSIYLLSMWRNCLHLSLLWFNDGKYIKSNYSVNLLFLRCGFRLVRSLPKTLSFFQHQINNQYSMHAPNTH